MNKAYAVEVCGGYWEESYTCIVRMFASKDAAEAYKEEFLNSPEREDYEDLDDVYVVEYDVY